jgi:hypothetical protein
MTLVNLGEVACTLKRASGAVAAGPTTGAGLTGAHGGSTSLGPLRG